MFLLARRGHKDKIVLLGFSWGSILGIPMVKLRPDLFCAYVGTGQISDMAHSQQMSYAYVVEKARAANDTRSLRELQHIGPPPFNNMDKMVVYFQTLSGTNANRTETSPAQLSLSQLFAAGYLLPN